jgi:hypothetical protein
MGHPHRVRLAILKRFEMSERALADAYRRSADLAGVTQSQRERLALMHLDHAAQLRRRLTTLGGQPTDQLDDAWVFGESVEALRMSERESVHTYHDHLLDMDEATMTLIRDHIVHDHEAALELLDPSYAADRDGIY